MHTGSCLCGAVTFEVNGPLPAPSACHCTQCRKHSGHFEASTDIPRSSLTIHGSENVTWYQSSEKVRRGFCSTCGSSLFWDPIQKDWTAVAMGAFDKPTNTKLKMHIFTGDKGDYYDISDELPQIPAPRAANPTTQIDTSLIGHTLSMSYEERIDTHQSALELIEDLQAARKEGPALTTNTEIDEALIDYNLTLSYEARILQHERALATYLELERAGQKMRKQLELNEQFR